MKEQEELISEAQQVLECIGNKIKSEGSQAVSSDDFIALSALTDAYTRLYALLK